MVDFVGHVGSMLVTGCTQASIDAILGAVVVRGTACRHSMSFEVILRNTEAFTNTMYTTLVRPLWRKGTLGAVIASIPRLANTCSVQTAAMSRALVWTNFLLASAALVARIANTGAVLRRTVGATAGFITVSTTPARRALAHTLNASSPLAAHLGPAGGLGAIRGDESFRAHTLTKHTLAIATAVLGTLQITTRRACEVHGTYTCTFRVARPMCWAGAIVWTLFERAIFALEA